MTDTEKHRRKSSTDAYKEKNKDDMPPKDGRRKSTVAKLWQWIATKSKEDDEPGHKRHAKKVSRAHTVAITNRIREDSEEEDVFEKPSRRKGTHVAPLTPPATPESETVLPATTVNADDIKPTKVTADETLPVERKLTNVDTKGSGKGDGGARPKSCDQKGKTDKQNETSRRRRRKRRQKMQKEIDTSMPLEFPCTPELLLEYHKKKPVLTKNEEWLILELNEYECLIENMDIVHKIAKFTKFFEMDPPELLDELFEFVDEVPSYDEIINWDVWQQFRDERYPY